VTATLTFPL
jgi:hypothetical protein